MQANCNGERLSKFCQDHHMVMVNAHHPEGGPTYWNALGGREVESQLDYILLPATRLQMVTHCCVIRREGRRLQLIPHRRPRDHWPLMIRAKLELLYGGVTVAPQHAVAWDFDASCLLFMIPIDGYHYSKKWRNGAQLTASTRQGCRLEESLFTLQTNHVIFLTGTKRPRAQCSPVTHSVLAGYRLFEWDYGMGRGTNRHAGLIVTVKLDICETWQIREVASPQAGVQGRGGASSMGTGRSSITTGPMGETRSLTDVAPSTEAGREEKRPQKDIFNVPSSIRPSSSDWRSFLCGPRENGGCEGVEAKWPRSDQLELQRGPLATALTPMKKLPAAPCRPGRSREKSGL